MIAVLTGGTGGAKFVEGLHRAAPAEQLTCIVNTGDDFKWWGLHISPDLDSITYALAGRLSPERGWGIRDDTFFCLQTMRELGEPSWFQTGDRDLAVHLLRSRMLAEGKTLSEAAAVITAKLGADARILPMTDSPVETRIETPEGELNFQEYFVRRHHQDQVKSVRFDGAAGARPAPGVVEAIHAASAVILAPSNPITSIGPILAVPGIREALRATPAEVVAVSPIIGNSAVSGPAGALMAAQGYSVSIAGIAHVYADFLDILVVDRRDADSASGLNRPGLRVHCDNTIMRTTDDKTRLAQTVLALADAHSGTASDRS